MPLNRVLVADDSRVFRAVTSETLQAHGLEVLEAANGSEALNKLVTERPELVVLDGLMPLLSGFEVIRRMREAAPDYEPVIFLVTAVYKSYRLRTEAIQQYGVDEYMEKPIEPEDLIHAVAHHFPEFLGLPNNGSWGGQPSLREN